MQISVRFWGTLLMASTTFALSMQFINLSIAFLFFALGTVLYIVGKPKAD